MNADKTKAKRFFVLSAFIGVHRRPNTLLRFYSTGAVCDALVTPGGSSMIRIFRK